MKNNIASVIILLALASCVPQEPQEPQKPSKIVVTGIVLDRVNVSLTEGESTTLVPTISPANATDKSVTWSSSNEAVATVKNGLVNALKEGTAVITAKTNDGGNTASCTVTVDFAIAAITDEATHISCRNAVLSGKIRMRGKTNLSFGILYSTNSNVLLGNAVQIQDELPSNISSTASIIHSFTVNTEVLEPETVYYYRSYMSQNNKVVYGETKSFTTLPVSSMINVADCSFECFSATLYADYDLTDCRYNTMDSGFRCVSQDGQQVDVQSTHINDRTHKFWCEIKTLYASHSYEISAYLQLDGKTYYSEKKQFMTKELTAVDMGLSVKWASANIGAEQDYGNHFAWGETESKSLYSWSTYKWCRGSFTTLTKYCSFSKYGAKDNKRVLDPEDDVAHVKFGGKWRMPTLEEWRELIDTTKTKFTFYSTGVRITSRQTGNSIFLPKAPMNDGYVPVSYDYHSYYWSSTGRYDPSYFAFGLHLNSSGVSIKDNIIRSYGCIVRPVCEY